MNRFKFLLTSPKTFAYSCRAIHHSAWKRFPDHQTQFQNAGLVASLLKSRSVIRFRGPDTLKFLQGLLTNDVRRFAEYTGELASNFPTPNVPSATVPPMYAALLTPQGRFLYDLFLYKPPRSDMKLDKTGTGPGSDPDAPFDLLAEVDASVLDEIGGLPNGYKTINSILLLPKMLFKLQKTSILHVGLTEFLDLLMGVNKF